MRQCVRVDAYTSQTPHNVQRGCAEILERTRPGITTSTAVEAFEKRCECCFSASRSCRDSPMVSKPATTTHKIELASSTRRHDRGVATQSIAGRLYRASTPSSSPGCENMLTTLANIAYCHVPLHAHTAHPAQHPRHNPIVSINSPLDLITLLRSSGRAATSG